MRFISMTTVFLGLAPFHKSWIQNYIPYMVPVQEPGQEPFHTKTIATMGTGTILALHGNNTVQHSIVQVDRVSLPVNYTYTLVHYTTAKTLCQLCCRSC